MGEEVLGVWLICPSTVVTLAMVTCHLVSNFEGHSYRWVQWPKKEMPWKIGNDFCRFPIDQNWKNKKTRCVLQCVCVCFFLPVFSARNSIYPTPACGFPPWPCANFPWTLLEMAPEGHDQVAPQICKGLACSNPSRKLSGKRSKLKTEPKKWF